jgi:hypothetical protein
MSSDPKHKARVEVRRAQAEFERAQARIKRQRAEARAARRKSFERAQERGLTVRDIAEVIGLDFSRVAEILRGE